MNSNCNPTTAWINVNRQCNFRCQWCYGEGTHYKPEENMSIETAKELVRIGIETGVKTFILVGGEPTLWPHLFEFNRFCKKMKVETSIITNAAIFGDNKFWEKYKEYPCDSISVSVKSVDRIGFKNVTRSNLFEQTMEGIRRAIGFGASVSTVHNTLVGTSGLIEIAKKCKEFGANFFNVDICNATISDKGIPEKGFSFEPHKLAQEIMKFQPVLDAVYKGNIDIEMYLPLCLFPAAFIEKMFKNRQIGTLCHVYSRKGLVFNTNGDVIPCNCMFNTVIAEKENFYDKTSLLKYLNSRGLKRQYRELLRYPSEECNDCRWEKECHGGCLINWMVFNPSEICNKVPKN